MRIAIDEQNGNINSKNAVAFDKALKLEERNITENGEQKAVLALRKAFENSLNQDAPITEIRLQLRNIDELNMNAIVKKNENAQRATEKATIYLSVTAAITFIILFSFIVNFPGFIANPLRDLREGIKELAARIINNG